MKINLQSLKFSAKSELKAFVEEKVSKLSRFDDKILSAEVTLILEESKLPENKTCEIRLVVPGNDNFVKKTCESFEEAILTCVDTMQIILKKHKEKSAVKF